MVVVFIGYMVSTGPATVPTKGLKNSVIVDNLLIIESSLEESNPSIFMPKRTYQPKKKRYSKKHGFLKRSATPTGRNVLKRRRAKGRKRLAAAQKGTAKTKRKK